MRLNQVSTTEWDRLFVAAKTLAKQPLIIGDKPGLTVPEFRSVIRKIKREIEQGRIPAKKLGIAAVDYLQLMTGDKAGNRELEVSSLSRGLKGLAKNEKLCVVALAQVNRDPEKKIGDKRPGLSTLRECLAGDQWVYDAKTGSPELQQMMQQYGKLSDAQNFAEKMRGMTVKGGKMMRAFADSTGAVIGGGIGGAIGSLFGPVGTAAGMTIGTGAGASLTNMAVTGLRSNFFDPAMSAPASTLSRFIGSPASQTAANLGRQVVARGASSLFPSQNQ